MSLFSKSLLVTLISLVSFSTNSSAHDAKKQKVYDVVVYGGTSAGIVAAIQVKKMGKTVILIEPSKHVGGLTTGGLGATDIGNKAAIGGMSRDFYVRIGDHYRKKENWKYEKMSDYKSGRQKKGDLAFWTFEPHVAMKIYQEMLKESQIPVVYQERLKSVTKQGTTITTIKMENGKTYSGKMFIDATYEGDLLAKGGVSYHIGREAESKYGETVNGVRTKGAIHHQFRRAVDPYIIKGDPTSGLLPLIQKEGPGKEGAGDHRVQAYCFRMCTTNVPENRRKWTKPKGYNVKTYELLLRNFEAGDRLKPWHPTFMPNRKTDTNNNGAVSTDYIGANYKYPDADWKTRDKIIKEHELYQKGLMYTFATNPRVPEKVRKHFQSLGLAKDEFIDNDNWPHQLYIREARRMVSDYVVTQKDCDGQRQADDSVGLGAYNMDSHNVQRYAKNGRVYNEGDIQLGVSPYAISYRSIRPKKTECTNLLVPICLSSSHMAFGSIRMEPVFMVLAQSAATAACHAIDENKIVQDIDIEKLQTRLLADKQIIEWGGYQRIPRLRVARMKGIVVDNIHATLTGTWKKSSGFGGFVERGYLHDENKNKGAMKVTFQPNVEKEGLYEVRLYYIASANRASNVPVTIQTNGKSKTVSVNQRKKPKMGTYLSLGTFPFIQGQNSTITISNEKTNGYVIVDAVQLVSSK
ncbi:probable secreted protein-putative xanthan lyase related [hydrothermal vent metagenome]|uniref:Probable secreted protein-putative xanthan lyase related n=1 Tax=hydrothermal vent metagenome TaxID=652676 RepID=A0A3B1DJR0_9ZZZZ